MNYSSSSIINTDNIQSILYKLGPPTGNRTIITHPDNLQILKDACDAKISLYQNKDQINSYLSRTFYGFDIKTDINMPRTHMVETGQIIWHNDRFIDYSYNDDNYLSYDEYISMCIYFGWCHKKMREELLFYIIDKFPQYLFQLKLNHMNSPPLFKLSPYLFLNSTC